LADVSSGSGPIVTGIAGRYATALFELASEAGDIAGVGRDLDRFDALVAGSDDLAALAAVLAKAGIGGLVANFVRVLATKRRLFAVQDIAKAFRRLADDRAGVVQAEVTVAEPLSDKNRKAVADALTGVTGKASVTIAEKIDPSIIGGLIVKVGSRMVDSSLRTKLNALKVAMKEVR
jgi:F-type H+-transporting ATPase subunit delta